MSPTDKAGASRETAAKTSPADQIAGRHLFSPHGTWYSAIGTDADEALPYRSSTEYIWSGANAEAPSTAASSHLLA
jgi:hypothetical protein